MFIRRALRAKPYSSAAAVALVKNYEHGVTYSNYAAQCAITKSTWRRCSLAPNYNL